MDAAREDEREAAEIAEKKFCDEIKKETYNIVKTKLAVKMAVSDPTSPLTSFLHKEKIKEIEEKEINKIEQKKEE